MVRICHASIDEHGKISGGEKGDQTGKEVCVRSYYSKPWGVCLRHPKEEIANKIAKIAETLANSNLVGYDQTNRNELHDVMKLFNHDANAYIMSGKKTETDCSAFATECAIAGGVATLEYTGNAPTTTTMERRFKSAGFNVLTQSRYLTNEKFLKRGDILVAPGKHTVIVLDDGEPTTTDCFPPYKGRATSIAYALDDMGIDSSKSYRKKIYEKNFTDKYVFSAYQNTEMLKKLKSGDLLIP